MLALLLASAMAFAQPDVEKLIIFVGADDGTARAEDQVCIDSLSQWVNIEYMGSSEFNDATADQLYGESGLGAEGVIISESIGSTAVPNFGRRDNYPVPAIIMEGVITGDNTDETRWPLLIPDQGGTWGYGTPEAVDVQWKINDNFHYVTEQYNVGEVINYADSPDRGVPYIHHIAPEHLILATANRTEGGDNADFDQSQAVALGYIVDPPMIYMNVAYTYLAVASVDFYNILHRSVKYIFDAFPVGVDQVRTEEFGLTVFPNPAANEAAIRFSAEAGKDVSVNLYSLIGSELGSIYQGVTSGGAQEIRLNTSEYPSGVYMVELEVGKKVSHSKFVIKR